MPDDRDSLRTQKLTLWIDQYQVPLLRMCRMYLPDKTSAEDAVQETFLKAYQSFPSFRGECSEKTWLMRIALNTCRDILRTPWFRHQNRRVTPDALPDLPAPEDVQTAALAEEIRLLPRKYRDVLLLYYDQGLTTMEVAQTLHISCATVSRRLCAARSRLRGALQSDGCSEQKGEMRRER